MHRRKSNFFHDISNQSYDDCTRFKLYNSTKASLQLIQRMSLLKRLQVHRGCVNSIVWNSTGDIILSGSDDHHLVLTNPYNYTILTDYRTSHKANIFSAKFLPDTGDNRIVSCGGDGIILYTDLMRPATPYCRFTCHDGTAYEIATIPGEPHSFLSCGEDGTVRWFDLRVKKRCSSPRCEEDVLISCQRAVTALSVNPLLPHQIAIGCSDSTVRTFDRRTLGTIATGWTDNGESVRPLCSFTVPEFNGESYRITSLSYSPDGQDVLVSYSSDNLYLFSIKDQGIIPLKKDITMVKGKGKRHPLRSPQPVRRLRLRGDWSDTGPRARPEREGGYRNGTEIAQARPILQTSLLRRMTDVLSRMLNDPATRAALSGGGEDSLEGVIDQQENNQQNNESLNETNDVNNSDRESQPLVNRNDNENNQENDMEEQEDEQVRERNENLSTATTVDKGSNERSTVDIPNNTRDGSTMMENLQDRLTTMRDGFLERHGSEPSVNLTYSDKSTSNATISLGVSDEVVRDNYHPGPSGLQSQSHESSVAGPSNTRNDRLRFNDIQEKAEDSAFIDSDDEDVQPDQRVVNSIETEMDEAIASARSSQGYEIFDETCLTELCVKQKYMGHRNARTMIKEANFWGDQFVMSGSDCGHVFVWERDTAKLCMLLEADRHVVNCIQPHPFLPMLATSGIDYDVKLWAPIREECCFDETFAENLKQRNAIMLEETKDTITVPATFMIRMLSCLNHLRRGRGVNWRRRSHDPDDLRDG